jgi:hypothetical protein
MVASRASVYVLLAEAAWSVVEAPPDGPLVDWHRAYSTVVEELGAASMALTSAAQPGVSGAELAMLADAVDGHVAAAQDAIADAALALAATS